MNWLEIAAIALVCLGLAAGAFLFARRPEFWVEFGYRLFERLWPLVWRVLSKRMDPKEEAEWRREQQAGRGDEWLRDRMRRKRRP